ncbi:hypothetical protein B296_00027330 [Ensete ventricosum]|uniref:Uncharacterized protein n=1 Tax=Ensete ventricosum TaxID=4639 RepID=A0A427APW7_ENSVE|nr:hypothetical protein B296_00027330 [Ensete ventricosum]
MRRGYLRQWKSMEAALSATATGHSNMYAARSRPSSRGVGGQSRVPSCRCGIRDGRPSHHNPNNGERSAVSTIRRFPLSVIGDRCVLLRSKPGTPPGLEKPRRLLLIVSPWNRGEDVHDLWELLRKADPEIGGRRSGGRAVRWRRWRRRALGWAPCNQCRNL